MRKGVNLNAEGINLNAEAVNLNAVNNKLVATATSLFAVILFLKVGCSFLFAVGLFLGSFEFYSADLCVFWAACSE